MQEKVDKPRGISESMLWVSVGLGTIYWVVDAVLTVLTSTDSSFLHALLGIDTRGFWQRLIVLCFFVIFGSHVQYTAKKRRESEEALLETEERFRALVETSTDAIVSVNEQMQVIQWNRAASDLFGFPKELMMGKPVDILIPEKFRPKHLEGFKRFLATGDAKLVGKTAEFECLRKDGTTRPIELSLSADNNNGPWTFTAIIRETTERRRALEALRESEERYRNLFEDSKDGVLIWTAEGKILGVNQAALETFGSEIEDMIGAEISEIYADPLDLVAFQQILDREGAVRGHELLLKKKDGAVMDALLTATVRRGKDHAILGYQGIVRDVTDLKRNERELKRTLETLQRSIGAITLTLSTVVESRDPYTAGHQKRVANLSRAIAQEMDLSPSLCDAVLMAGTLHDIGKIAIPSEILSSPAKLSDKAYELIKDHPQTGYDILREIEFPWPVANIVLQHHEKMDGSGYPKGLSGNDIMLEARIIAVADVVESMASHRPYRPSRGLESALEEIVHNSGTFYDPDVVAACVRLLREKGYQLERT
jgi:PAS domain S-box-containing protein/putative nucleotidyltransferase with HDIG domain